MTGISLLGVVCLLARAARIYLAIDRLNHSGDRTQSRSYDDVGRPFPSRPAGMPPQTYSYTPPNPGSITSSFAAGPQFGPTPAQVAARQARDQMNQNLQRMQQMQAESLQRAQQMQAENLQRMQQMRSQLQQRSFPSPGGMRPPWTGR